MAGTPAQFPSRFRHGVPPWDGGRAARSWLSGAGGVSHAAHHTPLPFTSWSVGLGVSGSMWLKQVVGVGSDPDAALRVRSRWAPLTRDKALLQAQGWSRRPLVSDEDTR
ncbi:hypothetical protein O3P69_005596 [Scylla paramamosain]|uniref:Uncharacterized protein n=1 Tax=Scylla paramamosain TaxID=85552 RepID=A0AAW0U695_SCYPA